jgi:hypothetical protein
MAGCTRKVIHRQCGKKQFIYSLEAIMEMLEIEIVEVELKYCERCGALWLRPIGSQGVFCGTCAPKMAAFEFAGEGSGQLPWSRPIDDGGDFESNIEQLAALCGEGGNA